MKLTALILAVMIAATVANAETLKICTHGTGENEVKMIFSERSATTVINGKMHSYKCSPTESGIQSCFNYTGSGSIIIQTLVDDRSLIMNYLLLDSDLLPLSVFRNPVTCITTD